MPNQVISKPISPLRRRMMEDMVMRGLCEGTQRDYLRVVSGFAAFLGRTPDTASADDKGRKDRNAMLSPQLLGLLRLWWREGRRRGVMLPHGWLFPARGARPTSHEPGSC